MIHAFNGAGAQHSLSPVDAVMGGDGTSMRPEFRASLVNIAHIQKINDLRGALPRPQDHQRAPLGRWRAGRRTLAPAQSGDPLKAELATCTVQILILKRPPSVGGLTPFASGEARPSGPLPVLSVFESHQVNPDRRFWTPCACSARSCRRVRRTCHTLHSGPLNNGTALQCPFHRVIFWATVVRQ